MAIIVVGGSNSGVGKTSLVCGLIAALPEFQWTAVKITAHSHKLSVANTPGTIQAGKLQADLSSSPNPNLTHAHRASFVRQLFDMRAEARADMRESAPAKGSIFEETVPGDDTDTARYLAAGAVRALVVSAPGGDLSDPLNQLWPRFGRGTNLIFESNSVIHHVRADACLLIHDVAERALPLPERKPSFLAAVRHADAMVARGKADKVIPEGLCLAGPDQAPELLSTRPIFHLASLERVSPDLRAWLLLRLDPTPRP
jgi:hypothetical protein